MEFKKNDQKHARVKYPHWEKHKSNDFLPLKEETNINFINSGQLPHATPCTRCKRTLVNFSKSEYYNKVFYTIFNSGKPVMFCEKLLTDGHPACTFFVLDDYKERLIADDSHKKNNGTPSRPKNKRGNQHNVVVLILKCL